MEARARMAVAPALIVAAAGLLLASGAVLAAPTTQDACPGAPAAQVFWQDDSWLENLAFAGGALYVGDAGDDRLLRLDGGPDVATVAEAGQIHGVAADRAGRIHIGVLHDGATEWEIQRLGEGAPQAIAQGLTGANGMAFSAAGDLYYSDMEWGVHRIPAGSSESSPFLEAPGANGLAIDDALDALYVALMDDARSTILRVGLADPANVTEVAHLSFGAARVGVFGGPPLDPRDPSDPASPANPKGMDDLALGPDGLLYVAALFTGEILRVDPATGAACVLATGLAAPTSARFARGFGEHDGDLFVTVAGNVGLAAMANDDAGAVIVLDTNLAMPGWPEPPAAGGADAAAAVPVPLVVGAAALLLGALAAKSRLRERR